jgi:hypothetical protein
VRRTIYKRSLVLLILTPITFLTGCGLNGGDRTLEETVEQTYPVDPTATLAISNADGSVRVYGADVTEISVKAVKKALSAARLRKIDVNISARHDAVSIETNYPPKKTWGFGDRSGTVDYILIVPQTCKIAKLDLTNGEVLVEGMRSPNVQAHLENGRIFSHNCFGNIHLTAINGGIDLYYDWWEEEQKFLIDAAIVNGSVRAFIPIDASFHLIAETEEGHIANDFAEKEQRHAVGVTRIDRIVGTNTEAEVRLHAKSGNIKVGETNM